MVTAVAFGDQYAKVTRSANRYNDPIGGLQRQAVDVRTYAVGRKTILRIKLSRQAF